MRMMAQRVKKQDVKVLQLRERFLRNAAEIGKVRSRAKAIRLDERVTVKHGQRRESCAEQVQRTAYGMDLDLRQSAVFVIAVEDVAEDAAQHALGSLAGIQRNLAAAGDARKAERPDVVEAEDVVGMAVRVEYRVNPANALADCLLAKIRSGV